MKKRRQARRINENDGAVGGGRDAAYGGGGLEGIYFLFES